MTAKTMVIVARVLTSVIATAHLLGLAMFWSTNQVVSVAVPLALLILAIRPSLASSAAASLLVAIGYIVGGIPFLDSAIEADVRAMHLVELLLFAVLVAHVINGNSTGNSKQQF